MDSRNDIITTAQGLEFSYAEIGAYLTSEAPSLIGKESTDNLTFSQYNALFEVVGLHFFPTMKEFRNSNGFDTENIMKLARLYLHYCNAFSVVPSVVGFSLFVNLDYCKPWYSWINQTPDGANLKSFLLSRRENNIKDRLMSEYKTPIGSIAVANTEYKWNSYGMNTETQDRISSIDELPPLLEGK